MTTTELIAKMQTIERQRGILDVCVEAKVTGVDLMDEGGNRMEEMTIGAPVEEVSVAPYGESKDVVWLTGTIPADKLLTDDEEDELQTS